MRNYSDATENPGIRIGVMGGPNVGKTSFINAAADIELPVGPIVDTTGTVRRYVSLTGDECAPAGVVAVCSPFMAEANLEFVEIHSTLGEGSSASEVTKTFAQFDACVFIVNAHAPLSQSELFILRNLAAADIPTLLVVSHVDRIAHDDRPALEQFVLDKVEPFDNLFVLMPICGLLPFQRTKDVTRIAVENLICRLKPTR